MPIPPTKIPQNVYVEDRIVGPLTLKQIIVVCIGGGFSYALWASISKAYGYVGIPLTILAWTENMWAAPSLLVTQSGPWARNRLSQPATVGF